MSKRYITFKKTVYKVKEHKSAIEQIQSIIRGEPPKPEEPRETNVTFTRRETDRNYVYQPARYEALREEFARLCAPYLAETERARHFDTFQIPKKSGGYRTIKAPHNDIGLVYARIAQILRHDLNILTHDAAWAYVEGRSTLGCLQRHQQNDSIFYLKFDFHDFFGTMSKETIMYQLTQHVALMQETEIVRQIAEIATLNNGLPQGTQLSPYLTNIVMVPFDTAMTQFANEHDIIYTRYADDLLFSSKKHMSINGIKDQIERTLETLNYRGLHLNHTKTRYGKRTGRNWNLGLMLNKDNNITLGHEFKREMKISLHKIAVEGTPPTDHIRGRFAYLKQIEPHYYLALDQYAQHKYRNNLKSLLYPE